MTRRRILLAICAATAAGVAGILALAAAADAWTGASTPVLVGLAAVFVTQPLYVIARHRKERRP